MKISLKYFVAVAAVILLTAGCTSPNLQSGQSQSGNASDINLEPAAFFADQEVAWSNCKINESAEEYLTDAGLDLNRVECAEVLAPLDWENPTSEDDAVTIAIMRVKATSENPKGAIFTNPGGPGASGLDLAVSTAIAPNFAPVATEYDVIGMDPRGIGKSTPVECPEPSYDIPEVALAECIAANPISHFMGTVSVAKDMNFFNSLLGYPEFNYLGYSYGTALGAAYAHLFPASVNLMVLDSGIPSDWSSPVGSLLQNYMGQYVVADLAESCPEYLEGTSAKCPFDSEDTFIKYTDSLNEKPLVTSEGEEVGGSDIYGFLYSSLYGNQQGQIEALTTVANAAAGDQTSIDELGGGATASSVDMSGTIVRCHSEIPVLDAEQVREFVDQNELPPMQKEDDREDIIDSAMRSACSVLPEKGDDYLPDLSAPTENPILVIGIYGDQATPYSESEQLVAELGNAELLTLDDRGHAASFAGRSQCIDDFVVEYFLTGEVPPAGTECPADE